MIDKIIEFNKTFVAEKRYEEYVSVTPTPYPSRGEGSLDTFSSDDATSNANQAPLPSGGVGGGCLVVAHSHCGACHMSFGHFHEEMAARGIKEETLDVIRKCGIDLNQWLEGFKDTPESVRKTVETIRTHPLVPRDIVVRGFIIDSETGALEEIC